jgi:hypothetical protein
MMIALTYMCGCAQSEEELTDIPKKKKKERAAWNEDDFAGGEKFSVKPSKKELKKMQKVRYP